MSSYDILGFQGNCNTTNLQFFNLWQIKIHGSGMFTKSAHINKLPRRRAIVQLVWGRCQLHILPLTFLASQVPFVFICFRYYVIFLLPFAFGNIQRYAFVIFVLNRHFVYTHTDAMLLYLLWQDYLSLIHIFYSILNQLTCYFLFSIFFFIIGDGKNLRIHTESCYFQMGTNAGMGRIEVWRYLFSSYKLWSHFCFLWCKMPFFKGWVR